MELMSGFYSKNNRGLTLLEALVATVIVGVIRFNQVPNLFSLIGLVLIIIGVLMVNLLGNN